MESWKCGSHSPRSKRIVRASGVARPDHVTYLAAEGGTRAAWHRSIRAILAARKDSSARQSGDGKSNPRSALFSRALLGRDQTSSRWRRQLGGHEFSFLAGRMVS